MNKKERVQPKEGEDKKDSFIAEINAGCTAPIRIVQLDLKKFNNNLIKTVKDNVKQNLKMLLFTAPGERVMLPDYGVGLKN